ncbi:MAG: squalene--hopene cyclase, partial [Planctomyces sp.]|nr:squalene--hopene cyclase [Planctomyces sp.]
QAKDGGWGAFYPNNTREIYTQVPFADHNAMIDPSTVDLTGRMLEMFASLNISRNHTAVKAALKHVWRNQERDFTWFGRWGVNYIYGTWQCLVGLTDIGVPTHDARVIKAAQWLRDCQQENGGWGETIATYDDPTLKGTGETTPSQTAWALMGLMAAGEVDSPAVARGIRFLLDHQEEDGTWEESQFTGTGFPRVFYLKYHYYRNYFPLMALARYRRLVQGT